MWYELMTAHAMQSLLQCWMYDYSWLSKVYVSVNAFRSVFPVKVVERECFTTMSSPFMDLSLATVAELCFAKQLANHLRCEAIVYYASIAQVCCWMGILTQNNLFHVYEEFLWCMIGYTCYVCTKNYFAKGIALLYCIYMIGIDIPMYMMRFVEQEDLLQDYRMHQCTLIHDLKGEYLWRTGYFVGASRLSMMI